MIFVLNQIINVSLEQINIQGIKCFPIELLNKSFLEFNFLFNNKKNKKGSYSYVTFVDFEKNVVNLIHI